MLTARGEEVDRVVGLELGADDYLPKPFSPRELVARIRAVMRRVPGEGAAAGSLIVWGPLRLDLRAHRAQAGERDLELTSAELRILELLVRADTRTVTRDELMEQALGRRLLPTDRSLDTHVSNLRRKIARCTDRVNVQSVRGAGYALTLLAPHAVSTAPSG
jgi:two-component system response regulator CpxR